MNLRRIVIDWMIGWHDAAKVRHQRDAERHAEAERIWRERYEKHWPNPFGKAAPR